MRTEERKKCRKCECTREADCVLYKSGRLYEMLFIKLCVQLLLVVILLMLCGNGMDKSIRPKGRPHQPESSNRKLMKSLMNKAYKLYGYTKNQTKNDKYMEMETKCKNFFMICNCCADCSCYFQKYLQSYSRYLEQGQRKMMESKIKEHFHDLYALIRKTVEGIQDVNRNDPQQNVATGNRTDSRLVHCTGEVEFNEDYEETLKILNIFAHKLTEYLQQLTPVSRNRKCCRRMACTPMPDSSRRNGGAENNTTYVFVVLFSLVSFSHYKIN